MISQRHRRLVCGLVLVLAWAGFVIDGSHALFTDSATLAGNSITSGSTDLLISNSQNGGSNLFAETRPGFSHKISPAHSDENYIFLKNSSPSEISLDIDVSIANPSITNSEITRFTTITIVAVDANGESSGTPVGSSMNALMTVHAPLGVSIPPGGTQRLRLMVGFAPELTVQNQTMTYDLVFTGTQRPPNK